MLDKAKARAIINRIQELDEERGQDAPWLVSDPGNGRDVVIDGGLKAELIKRILPRGAPNVPRSRAHAGRVVRRMRTHPRSMVQLRVNGAFVFWAVYAVRQIEVLLYCPGSWESHFTLLRPDQ